MMKNSLSPFLLSIALTAIFSTKVFSQTHVPVLRELVLAIPDISEKSYTEITNAISAIDGITLAGYCKQHKCYLIYFDNNKIQSGDEIAKIVQDLNGSYKTEIKEGASISDLLVNCTQFPSTLGTIK